MPILRESVICHADSTAYELGNVSRDISWYGGLCGYGASVGYDLHAGEG